MGLNKPGNISGVAVHNELTGRNDADGHPIGAISGLQTDLTNKASAITGATNTANTADGKATTALATAQTADSNATTALGRIGTLGSLATSAKGNLVEAINENFTNANNGKVVIASAVNGKGGTANAGMTFPQLADAVTAIPNVNEATGTAVAGDVRSGKTFSNSIGNGIAGTLNLSNLIPGNIRQGVTIDGVAGNVVPGITLLTGTPVNYRDLDEIAKKNGSGTTTVLELFKKVTVNIPGTFSVYFEYRNQEPSWRTYYSLRVNGVETNSGSNQGSTWVGANHSVSVNAGDIIELFARTEFATWNAYVRNFELRNNILLFVKG
jgi:hypothetical protein